MSACRNGLLLLAAAVVGCGGQSGPPRYEISGTVTYSGQPTPAGQVTFAPDSSRQNRGPGGYGKIINGKYTTVLNRGAVGGPHRVTITGYNAEPGTVSDSELKQLHPVFETTVDLPRESCVQNFDVPSTLKP